MNQIKMIKLIYFILIGLILSLFFFGLKEPLTKFSEIVHGQTGKSDVNYTLEAMETLEKGSEVIKDLPSKDDLERFYS